MYNLNFECIKYQCNSNNIPPVPFLRPFTASFGLVRAAQTGPAQVLTFYNTNNLR